MVVCVLNWNFQEKWPHGIYNKIGLLIFTFWLVLGVSNSMQIGKFVYIQYQ